MQHYIALVHKERGTSYGISFPDFPGCIAAADSYAATVEQAAAALAFHVKGMRQDGEAVPVPRGLAEIEKANEDWIDFENAVVAMIPLMAQPSEPQPG